MAGPPSCENANKNEVPTSEQIVGSHVSQKIVRAVARSDRAKNDTEVRGGAKAGSDDTCCEENFKTLLGDMHGRLGSSDVRKVKEQESV